MAIAEYSNCLKEALEGFVTMQKTRQPLPLFLITIATVLEID